MSIKIVFPLLMLLASSSFSQSSRTSPPTFSYQLNGVEANGIIHKSDTILTVSCSDGNQYNILSIEVNCNNKVARISGSTFSNEMKDSLNASAKGQRIIFLMTLSDQNNIMMKAVAAFQLE